MNATAMLKTGAATALAIGGMVAYQTLCASANATQLFSAGQVGVDVREADASATSSSLEVGQNLPSPSQEDIVSHLSFVYMYILA